MFSGRLGLGWIVGLSRLIIRPHTSLKGHDAGTSLGPYEVTALIGSGRMGEVYRARDTKLDRDVALTVLPAHVASDPGLTQRFEREANTPAALSHPHIYPVFDVGQQDVWTSW